jgi:hypothetical protein
MGERATLITEHMTAMGALDKARILYVVLYLGLFEFSLVEGRGTSASHSLTYPRGSSSHYYGKHRSSLLQAPESWLDFTC